MTGKFTAWPWVSSMSLSQERWDSTESTDRPMSFVLRLSNSDLALEKAPSSVVHTGVKSLGWENRIPHESPSHSWKLIVPWVVSAVKSGAMSPKRTAMAPPAFRSRYRGFVSSTGSVLGRPAIVDRLGRHSGKPGEKPGEGRWLWENGAMHRARRWLSRPGGPTRG